MFGYFAVEPLRSSQSTNGSFTFADPQFTAFAQANFPNTVGTHLLSTYLPANLSGVSVSKTAQDIFGAGDGLRNCSRQNGVPAIAHDRRPAHLGPRKSEMARSTLPE